MTTSRTASIIGGLLLVLGVFYWIYLAQIRTLIHTDGDGESWDAPVAVGFLEMARARGVSPSEYFSKDPTFDNVKEQDDHHAHAYPRHRFRFEFFAYNQPLPSFLYLPFVKALGVGPQTVIIYSTFFSFLALVITGWLARSMFGWFEGVLAPFLLLITLSWMIHVQAGHASWMPSVILVLLLVAALYQYRLKNERHLLLVGGVAIGMMYMTGWITVVPGALIGGLALFWFHFREPFKLLQNGVWVAGSAILAVLGITWVYMLFYRCGFMDVHLAMFDNMFNRFTQGGSPGHNPSVFEKVGYALKCLVIDSTTFDHKNKCLEGKPVIPYIFNFLFVVGLYFSLRRKSVADQCLWIWLISVFGFLTTISLFTHRYSLLLLPAMAMVAARGMVDLFAVVSSFKWPIARQIFGVFTFLGLAHATWLTHHQFYGEYRQHKAVDFELDRGRGQQEFVTWLKKNCPPSETLLALDEPIVFQHMIFFFNAFDEQYRFIYLSNYFSPQSTPEEVERWEKTVFQNYKRIIYAFSAYPFFGPDGRTQVNDPRPFLAAHPGLEPVMVYSYDQRPPNFAIFEVKAKVP